MRELGLYTFASKIIYDSTGEPPKLRQVFEIFFMNGNYIMIIDPDLVCRNNIDYVGKILPNSMPKISQTPIGIS